MTTRPALASTLFGLICLLFCVVAAAQAPSPDDEIMKVRGTAEVSGAGIGARSSAVRTAEREIVRKILDASLGLEDFTPLDAILRQPQPFIRSTQLIRAETTDTGTRVEVECFVLRKDLLKKAAQLLLPRMPEPPVVLIIMAEQIAPEAPLDAARAGAAESALTRELRDAKLEVEDPTGVRADAASSGGGSIMHENPARLAATTLAQAVLLGEAVVDKNERNGNAYTAHAAVTVRIYRATDGTLLDTLSEDATVQGANPVEAAVAAIGDACAKLARDAALYAVLAAVAPVKTDEVILTIEHPGARDLFEQVIEAAASGAGAGSVEEVFYTGRIGRLRVKYSGSIGDFVDRILAGAYQGFTLELHHVIQRDILIGIRP